VPEERDRSRSGQDQSEQDVDRRGLPRAVGAEQTDDLTGVNRARCWTGAAPAPG
jgi:hypothetical protein